MECKRGLRESNRSRERDAEMIRDLVLGVLVLAKSV